LTLSYEEIEQGEGERRREMREIAHSGMELPKIRTRTDVE